MRHTIESLLRTLPLMLAVALFAACSSGSETTDDTGDDNSDLATVNLYVSAPTTTRAISRTGDPGTDVQDEENWNSMAVIFVYTEQPSSGNLVRNKIITKAEYDALPDNEDGYKHISMRLPKGYVYAYAVTYSSDAANNPESAIKACATKADVENLTISNSYGDAQDVSQFLSVATGYYMVSGHQTVFEVKDAASLNEHLHIKLTRLAAKVDVQWDAQTAFNGTTQYKDVEVSGFTFYGDQALNTAQTDKGSGRLFPALYSGSEALGKSYAYVNSSEIARRNGRTYFYVFPDGVGKPKVLFNLGWTVVDDDSGVTTTASSVKTLQFTNPLKQAVWYYVSVTVKGNSASATYTIDN